jgi:prepilin-type N-terminal cleavage/methylation domain-containing protein
MKLPISATGISTPRRVLSRGDLQRGFTLWELLIVVAIVAITISMVQLSAGLGDENRDLKSVGKNLGFIVLEYNEGEWAQSSQSFFSKIKLTESQRSELIIENEIIDISIKDPPEPHILILSSGEMTPFEWRIRDKLTQSGILLQGNVLGGVLMTGPEPLG